MAKIKQLDMDDQVSAVLIEVEDSLGFHQYPAMIYRPQKLIVYRDGNGFQEVEWKEGVMPIDDASKIERTTRYENGPIFIAYQNVLDYINRIVRTR
jgi:hypothetical protein